MALNYYRFDDASAPSLNGTVSSLINVLDACLVSGYGAKSAAGWTKPFTGTNKAVFRMNTGAGKNGHYLRVLDDGSVADGGARTASMLGFIAMTTVDSGTDQFPNPTQLVSSGFPGLYFTKSGSADAVARPWFVVADDTFFFIYCWHNTTSFSALTPSSRQSTFMFGQFDSYNTSESFDTLIWGRNNGVYTDTSTISEAYRIASSATINTGSNNRTFLAKDFLGLNVSTLSMLVSSGNSSAGQVVPSGLLTYPNPITGGFDYGDSYVGEKDPGGYTLLRGTCPIVKNINHSLPDITSANSPIRSFDSFAGTGVDTGKTFIFVPQYYNSTAYPMLVQVSGDR